MRLRILQDVVRDATECFMEMSKDMQAKVHLNFRIVSHIMFHSIKDVQTQYAALSCRKDATALILIDGRHVHPQDIFTGETTSQFRFKETERCWKLLPAQMPEVEGTTCQKSNND